LPMSQPHVSSFDDGDVSDGNIVDGREHLKPSGRQQIKNGPRARRGEARDLPVGGS
jgi:hypothetical protein